MGEAAANESKEDIKEALKGADLIFVTIGAGGGTGSGAGYVVAEIAREMGILVIGVATRPFSFEGEKRRKNADGAILNLGRNVDTLITIPNDRYLLTHENMIKASASCCAFPLIPLQSETTVSIESKSGGSENLIFEP